jgi:hypothetical protein
VTLAAFSPSCSRTGGPNHIEGDGPTVFAHACKMGLEGIVSKRKDFALPLWPLTRQAQNEELGCTGVKREAEEEWGKRW